MAQRINAKSHIGPNQVAFGAIEAKTFSVAALPASAANTTVQDYFVSPYAFKLVAVAVAVSSAANGVSAFNICIGAAAEAGVLVADTQDQGVVTLNTTPGLSLFEAGTAPNFTGPQDQTIAIAAAYGSGMYYPSEPDAVFPQGTVLTLRLVTGAGATGSFKMYCTVVPVDVRLNFSSGANQPFTWANAIG
jgi:hypothetical protein